MKPIDRAESDFHHLPKNNMSLLDQVRHNSASAVLERPDNRRSISESFIPLSSPDVAFFGVQKPGENMTLKQSEILSVLKQRYDESQRAASRIE